MPIQPWVIMAPRGEGSALALNEWILACVIGIPVAFAIGRYSSKLTWFHTHTEEKYSVKEFLQASSRD